MRQFILLTSLIWSLTSVNAQVLPEDLKMKKWKFGIQTGVNYQILQASDGLNYGYKSNAGVGLCVGLITEYPVSEKISILPRLGFSFSGSSLSNGELLKYLMPITIEASSYVSLALASGKNHPYLYVGPSYNMPINTHRTILIKNHWSVDIGVGFNRFFSKFIFAPEIRYSRSVANVSKTILADHLTPHTVSLLMSFKG